MIAAAPRSSPRVQAATKGSRASSGPGRLRAADEEDDGRRGGDQSQRAEGHQARADVCDRGTMAGKRVTVVVSSDSPDYGRYPYRRRLQWPAGMAPQTWITSGTAGRVTA